MKKRLQALRNEDGLTLVELLAVIVILAIIAVVAFVMIGQVIENSRQDAHVANAQQMIASTKLYEAQGGELEAAAAAGDPQTILLSLLTSEDQIDTVYDSWTKDPILGGSVSKDGSGVYSVELDAEDDKCDLDLAEADLVKYGRDACGGVPTE